MIDWRTRRGQFQTGLFRGLGYATARAIVRALRLVLVVGVFWEALRHLGALIAWVQGVR